jgi:hypothetical protein
MKTIDYIPTSKIERATKLVQTGAKVGELFKILRRKLLI